MRILIDVNHPAHVHLFRCAARAWAERGHEVLWTARDKDLVCALLDRYGFAYTVLSSYGGGFAGMVSNLVARDWKLWRYCLRHKPDILIGTSVNITHVSRLYPARSVFFTESDPHLIRLIALLSFPFAHAIVMPAALADTWRYKQFKHRSSHKLAYLHPNWFRPDPQVLPDLGVREGETFFVLRFIAWGASHDLGQGGLDPAGQKRLIDALLRHGRVFVTSEKKLTPELEPYRFPLEPHRIHDALYYAALFLGDSQSMTIEAAILGTPSLRCNSFVGRTTAIEELEHRYGLSYGFRPSELDAMIAKAEALIAQPDLKRAWQTKRDAYLADKEDLTAWMLEFVEKFAAGGRRAVR